MAEKPKRVTARRVAPFYLRLLRRCSIDSILQLKRSLTSAEFDGKRYDSCVYGNLAKGAGYDFVDKTPDEIRESIRQFGRSIGVEIQANGHLDCVEQFCAHLGRGVSSPLTETIEGWCNLVLMEKGFNPFSTVETIGEEAVGV